jgi:hypothetical protein
MENEKPKKVQKMFDSLALVLSNQLASIQSNNKIWQDKVNDDLEKFKKKYNEMHGLLLRKFLVELESRVRLAEINSISLVKLYVHKFYELEKRLDPTFSMSFEEYYQRLSHDITTVSAQVTKEMEKEDEMAMAKTTEDSGTEAIKE